MVTEMLGMRGEPPTWKTKKVYRPTSDDEVERLKSNVEKLLKLVTDLQAFATRRVCHHCLELDCDKCVLMEYGRVMSELAVN